MVYNAAETNWDVERFADKVKNTRVSEDGESLEDIKLRLHYEQATFGKLTDPGTILDKHGKIMVWVLPGVLHPKRLVRNSMSIWLTYY